MLQAVPIYPMMSDMLPKKCVEDIHRLQRNFILGETNDNKNIHAVNWDTITKPKMYGGLGLRKLDMMNKTCISKLSWKIICNSDNLWYRVLRSKYHVEDSVVVLGIK